jgi:DNA-binding beta-propeller fold protein YncE
VGTKETRAALFVLLTLLATAARPLGAQAGPTNGTLVVVNKTPGTATILDVASGRTLASLPTGAGPHEVAITSDGTTAVVTDYASPGGGHTLTVLDVSGLRVARTIEMGEYDRPHGIRFLPGDSLVAVTSESTGNVAIVQVASGAVRRVVPTTQRGSHMVGVTADGRRGYTGNISDNTVSELDLTGGRFVRTFEVPAQPEAINVTPDGAEVWVGSNQTGRVSVVDPSSGTVSTAAEGFGWPYRVLFTPDLHTVVIPDMRGNEVRFLDRASRRELGRLSLPGAGPQGVTVTPDGRWLFLSLSQQATVAVIDLRTREVVRRLDVGDTPDGLAYTTAAAAGSR